MSQIADLRSDPRNPRQISPEAAAGLRASVAEFGDLSGLTWNRRTGELVCGRHQRMDALRVEAAARGGELRLVGAGDDLAVELPEGAGRPGAVFRVRVVDWDVARQRAANLAANNPAIQGTFSAGLESLLEDVAGDLAPGDFAALRLGELEGVARELARGLDGGAEAGGAEEPPEPQVDRGEELARKWGTRTGQVWEISSLTVPGGLHRVACGDSTDRVAVAALLAGETLVGILTDPPYCSGGFQESARSAGGASAVKKRKPVANDTLSTRGYQALIKAVLDSWPALVTYLFTDWRMWIPLFDAAESSGYGVRSMVVWDKGSPALGNGWRSQHELVMVAIRGARAVFDPHLAQGNVIRASRTKNVHHTTEKPVDVLERMLAVVTLRGVWADPFLGSGSTLLAAERCGVLLRGMELDPAYVAVTLQRLADAGLSPRLASKGA